VQVRGSADLGCRLANLADSGPKEAKGHLDAKAIATAEEEANTAGTEGSGSTCLYRAVHLLPAAMAIVVELDVPE
jgi:hypothetical protein